MMFGYACDETPELMPLPIALAHRITRRLAEVRRSELKWLRPDGKSQVTVEYRNGQPASVQAVVVAAQHDEAVGTGTLRDAIRAEVIDKVVPAELRSPDMKCWINATGRFVIGGPLGDSGVTGRKIIVDTYGGMAATAAALSRARILPRWIARPPMPRGGSRRMWSPPGSRAGAKSRSRMRSASPSR